MRAFRNIVREDLAARRGIRRRGKRGKKKRRTHAGRCPSHLFSYHMILRKTKFGLCRNHHTTYFCLYSLRLFHVYSVIISALYLQKCKKSFKIRFVLYTGCEKLEALRAQNLYFIYFQLILAYISDAVGCIGIDDRAALTSNMA